MTQLKKLKQGQQFTFEGHVLTKDEFNHSTKRFHCKCFRNRSQDRHLKSTELVELLTN